jgi:hypothetical protein
MGNSLGIIHFEDGLNLFAAYQNTVDLMSRRLHESPDDFPFSDDPNQVWCTCGNHEPVELATDYANGLWWEGRACRHCKAIEEAADPRDSWENYGYPVWWPS